MRAPMMRPLMMRASILLFSLLGTILGSEWIAVREIAVTPLPALAARFSIASLALWIGIALRQRRLFLGRETLVVALTGVSMLALPAILTLWATDQIPSSVLLVILSMTPLFAALLEGHASGRVLSALVGGVGGTALIASQGLSLSTAQVPGAAAALGASLLIAGTVVYAKRRFLRIPPATIAAIQLGTAAIFLAIFSLAGKGAAAFGGWSTRSIALEVALAILGNALGLTLYYWLLARSESFQVTALQWLATVVGVLEGVVWLRAMPSWRMLAGIACVTASLAVLLHIQEEDEAPLTLLVTPPKTGG